MNRNRTAADPLAALRAEMARVDAAMAAARAENDRIRAQGNDPLSQPSAGPGEPLQDSYTYDRGHRRAFRRW